MIKVASESKPVVLLLPIRRRNNALWLAFAEETVPREEECSGPFANLRLSSRNSTIHSQWNPNYTSSPSKCMLTFNTNRQENCAQISPNSRMKRRLKFFSTPAWPGSGFETRFLSHCTSRTPVISAYFARTHQFRLWSRMNGNSYLSPYRNVIVRLSFIHHCLFLGGDMEYKNRRIHGYIHPGIVRGWAIVLIIKSIADCVMSFICALALLLHHIKIRSVNDYNIIVILVHVTMYTRIIIIMYHHAILC